MDDICKKFGLNVKKFRELKGISQEKLAEESSLHRTYISAVERGKRSISLNNIQNISNALGIEVHKLFMFGDEDNN